MDTEVKVLLLVLFAVFTACFSFYQGNELHRLSNVLDVMAFNRGTGAEKLYRSYIVSREASKSGELCFTPASNAKLTWTMTGSNLFWAFCLTFGAFMAVVVICANSDRAKAIMNSSLSALTRFLEVYFPNQEIQRQVAAIQAQLTERYEAGYEAGREAVEDSSARQIRDTEAERELFREEAYALRRIETRLLQKVGALEKELVEEKGAKCNVCDKDKKWVIDKFQTNYDAANQEIERLEEEKKDLQNELSRASNYLSQEQRKAYQAEKDAREQKESADKEHKEFLKMEKDLARVRALAGSLISVEEQNKQLVQLTPQLEVVENMNRTQQTTINHMQAIIYNLLPGNQESRITWLETELEKAKKIGDWRHNECVRQHGDIWVSDGDYQQVYDFYKSSPQPTMVASAPSQYTSSGFVPIQVQQSGLALPQPHSSGTIPMQPQEPKESKPIYANNLPPALQAAQNAAMKPGPTFNSGTGFKPRITSMFASPPPTYFAATGQKSGASLDTSSGAFSMFFDKKEETPVDRGASSLFARTSR